MVEFKPVSDALSLAACARILFGLELSKYPKLKDGLNSMERNKLFVSLRTAPEGGKNSRGKVFFPRDQLDTIFNATLLHGFFSSPKTVKEIFNKPARRQEMADWLSTLLLNRNSIVGVGLLAPEVLRFLDQLGSGLDLRKHRLANPFVELPQLALNGVTGVVQGLLAQSALLNTGDSMMAAYLNGSLEQAYQQAEELQATNEFLLKQKQRIVQEYQEAQEFEETLDFFR